ncbi:hypothetical protein EDD21DRAFT_85761 [Dissophora ornata]|nr:hypothetical protein BGZ58_008319 [Dissophora ornata]KAI8602160.1 hypothetical protein EDD21DRAFT_85761 [Dissophora ornata]
MQLLVLLVILISVLLFSILFIHLYRVYRRLQIRHLKPLPSAIPPGLEQHQELAFVLAHGVEAYNEQRRLRQQQERAQARATATTSGSGPPSNEDRSSINSYPSFVTEPPPVYSADPPNGDVGYGWRVAGDVGLFSSPGITGNATSTTNPASSAAAAFAPHPLDNLLPPVYIYQAPSSRSTAQTALLSSDNSPTVTISTSSGGTQAAARANSSSGGRRRSVASGIFVRAMRGNQRSGSLSSSSSTSSSGTAPGLIPGAVVVDAAEAADAVVSPTPEIPSPNLQPGSHAQATSVSLVSSGPEPVAEAATITID